MRPRPLADRVAGIDDAARHGAPATMHPRDLDALRCVLADIVRRHGDLLDYFERGGQEELVTTTGIVGAWPEDPFGSGHVIDGLPRHGAELAPVALASLAAITGNRDPGLSDRVVTAAGRLSTALHDLDRVGPGDRTGTSASGPAAGCFARAVCGEYCDAIVVAALTTRT